MKLMGKKPTPIEARFWPKVRKGDGCWTWTAGLNNQGYGAIGVGSMRDGTRRMEPAHRVAWLLTRGPIPPGLFVCHRCDNPPCVNPDHLFLGTAADNNADKVSKGRHCKTNPKARGELHYASKLTAADALAIRAAGILANKSELARRFGVSRHTVLAIIRRIAWRHL